MFCPECGKEIPDNSIFCTFCGAKILRPGESADEQVPQTSSHPSSGIELCGDGMYRWYYEFSMLKNPMILLTILAIFGVIFGIIFLFLVISAVLSGDIEDIVENFVPFLLFLVFFAALILISYLIVSAMNGWKYIVLFEMNEEGVRHIQQPKQFQKAQALAWLSAFAGVVGGNPAGGIGRGLLVATKSESYTAFQNVKKMKSIRRYHTIKLNETLEHNQIYAEDKDYDFVLKYIADRIPEQAKRNL